MRALRMGRGFALQGLGVAAHATALRIKPPRLIAISDNRSAETHAVQLARLPNGTPSQCVGIQPRVRRRIEKRLLLCDRILPSGGIILPRGAPSRVSIFRAPG